MPNRPPLLRLARPDDHPAIEKTVYEAFKNAPHASGGEALLTHRLRDSPAFVRELDFVAEIAGNVAGSILYTKSRIASDTREWETLTFGPVSVLPACQRRGIGSALIAHTLKLARAMGFRAVIISGHEKYYPRFGFENAGKYGITTQDGKNFPAFMALPLYEGALDGINGRFMHDPIFERIGKAESDAFNARFQIPDPNVVFPVPSFFVTYVKPTVRNKNIIVGDFTYFSDVDFESHVTHHYDFHGDRLIIGKFCQIAAGVEFIMNGANHRMNAASTFPFYILEGWKQDAPPLSDLPLKGDTVVGNDVWIGQNAVILPGVHIGNGAIIGANAVVGGNVDAYTLVAGNPAKPVRKRFDDELIDLLQAFRWWDLPVPEIQKIIPVLSDGDLERVKRALKKKPGDA
ncbi:MAG: GNAT family N-acetyltransferase [Zoogloeaceae bacterium]|jgi:virginiamycin A acetyltransferase|nr:GNAT family N-acetyltransferase [Zoogloeaceae bacterium]